MNSLLRIVISLWLMNYLWDYVGTASFGHNFFMTQIDFSMSNHNFTNGSLFHILIIGCFQLTTHLQYGFHSITLLQRSRYRILQILSRSCQLLPITCHFPLGLTVSINEVTQFVWSNYVRYYQYGEKLIAPFLWEKGTLHVLMKPVIKTY